MGPSLFQVTKRAGAHRNTWCLTADSSSPSFPPLIKRAPISPVETPNSTLLPAETHQKPARLLKVQSGADPTRLMETLAQHPHQRFSGSDRLFGLFSRPEPATAGLELQEDDIFGSESPDLPMAMNPNPKPNPNNPSFRRFADHNFGILAALTDRNPNPNLMPKFSISCSSSSAMAIPPSAMAKAKQEKVHHSSAPVSIPVVNVRKSKGRGLEFGLDGNDDEDDEEMMMLPPHEIVARREGRESSPTTTSFSVLEGAGRTLKGRDLRRVRNAVFRRTGFED